jgi:hypothetical protein
MEQHGRRERRHLCPPRSFWDAALHHLSRRADVSALASAAENRWRLRYSQLLSDKAAQLPWLEPTTELFGQEPSGDWWYAMDDGEPDHLYCRALADLAFSAVREADYEQAAALASQAADCCQPDTLAQVALLHEQLGMPVEASDLAHQAAARGAPECLGSLAMMRHEQGRFDEAEHYAWEAAEHGLTGFLADLALVYEGGGNRDRAESLWETAVRYKHPEALANIARFQQDAGDNAGAARTALEAVDRGDAAHIDHRISPIWKTLWPNGIEPDGTPSPSSSAAQQTYEPKSWW